MIMCIIMLSVHSAIIEENNYILANDEEVDENIFLSAITKSIIKRVVILESNLENGNRNKGTALVWGNNCDQIITNKHNTHYDYLDPDNPHGRRISNDVSVVYKNQRVKVTGIPDLLVEYDWRDSGDDIILYKLEKSIPNIDCSIEIPMVTRQEIIDMQSKSNNQEAPLEDIPCYVAGFPHAVEFIKGKLMSAGHSAVIKKDQSFYPVGTRGLARCNLFGISANGRLFTNCDGLPGASGSPTICRASSGSWSVFGLNKGGSCKVNGDENHPDCYNAIKGPEVTTKDENNQVFSISATLIKALQW